MAEYASSDGQIRWRSSGLFTLNTPRTQAVFGFTGGEPVTSADVSVTLENPFGQVIVTSLTEAMPHSLDRPGGEHRPDLPHVPQGMESLGSGPILIEPLKATPILQHDGPAKPVVHALDWYGLRTNTTLPVEANPARGWKLTLGDVPAAWFEGAFDGAK